MIEAQRDIGRNVAEPPSIVGQSRLNDKDSTLVRRARNAATVSDISEFAMTLETRPLAKLLGDLPELAKVSDAKFAVASSVLRRRFRDEAPLAQLQLRASGLEIAGTIGDDTVARRIRNIFEIETA
jgi:hypothetical protein